MQETAPDSEVSGLSDENITLIKKAMYLMLLQVFTDAAVRGKRHIPYAFPRYRNLMNALQYGCTFLNVLTEKTLEDYEPVIDELRKTVSESTLAILGHCLQQEEITAILENPLASAFSKEWARCFRMPSLEGVEDALLLSSKICCEFFHTFNHLKIRHYYNEISKRELINQHLCTILSNKRIPLFFILDMGSIELSMEYLLRLRELLSSDFPLEKKLMVKSILLKKEKHLFRMSCRMGSLEVMESLTSTLAMYSRFGVNDQALFLPHPVAIPHHWLLSQNPRGLLPVHIAYACHHYQLAERLLTLHLPLTANLPAHKDPLFHTIIIKNLMGHAHGNLMHLVCQMNPQRGLVCANKLFERYAGELTKKLYSLDSRCKRPLDYIEDKEERAKWAELFGVMPPQCQRVIVLDLDETMVTAIRNEKTKKHSDLQRIDGLGYLYQKLFSALILYANIKGIHVYIVTLSKRDSLALAEIMGNFLGINQREALNYIHGYFSQNMWSSQEYQEFLNQRQLDIDSYDNRKHHQAEFLATQAGLDLQNLKFCLLEDLPGIVEQANTHGHHAVTATTLQDDPRCIIDVANFCGLAEEDIDSYDQADPILMAINILRAVLPSEDKVTVNSVTMGQ
jgi:hypothetical protein